MPTTQQSHVKLIAERYDDEAYLWHFQIECTDNAGKFYIPGSMSLNMVAVLLGNRVVQTLRPGDIFDVRCQSDLFSKS